MLEDENTRVAAAAALRVANWDDPPPPTTTIAMAEGHLAFSNFGMRKSSTGHSRPSGSFFTQVDHLFSPNCFSKQAMNRADFFTLKIWTQSDHWLKSYGQKVYF